MHDSFNCCAVAVALASAGSHEEQSEGDPKSRRRVPAASGVCPGNDDPSAEGMLVIRGLSAHTTCWAVPGVMARSNVVSLVTSARLNCNVITPPIQEEERRVRSCDVSREGVAYDEAW